RVLAVYVRNVTPTPLRREHIRALAAEVEAAGSALMLTDDTLTAAKHAAERGWIRPESVAGVEGASTTDGGPAASPATAQANENASSPETK
ncbi:MAG TPA: hypothetical protein VFH27_07720, partial [Longimicrobiaceae bacterium]|nr:hypothetical protein [Longimicrobiaceae bacterium]